MGGGWRVRLVLQQQGMLLGYGRLRQQQFGLHVPSRSLQVRIFVLLLLGRILLPQCRQPDVLLQLWSRNLQLLLHWNRHQRRDELHELPRGLKPVVLCVNVLLALQRGLLLLLRSDVLLVLLGREIPFRDRQRRERVTPVPRLVERLLEL